MSYPIDQSPFYRLQTKKKLASLLKISLKMLGFISHNNNNYNCFNIGKDGKTRYIQEPKEQLRAIHVRILELLSKIKTPEYLFSAVKGRSYISNALAHHSNSKLVKLDIKSFYPSTKYSHVYDFFHRQMHCSPDVSAILVNICTINGTLPTGSPISTLLAFFSHMSMFNELEYLARSKGLAFTAYVDDITFSGNYIPKGFLLEVNKIIRQRGLKTNKKKTRIYLDNSPKTVTGVIINNNEIKLPNRRKAKIKELLTQLRHSTTDDEKLNILPKLIGRVSEAAQIENKYRHMFKKLTEIQRNIKIKLKNDQNAESL